MHNAGADAPRPATVIRENIETLAAVVAKKYRISRVATREFVRAAYSEGKLNGLDPLLIVAVIGVESGFNPLAQSDFGAMGLMQVIPQYHRDKLRGADVSSVFDPRTNIQVGTRALKEYIARGGTETAGLQLYNGAADDASNAYATKVMSERARLRRALDRARHGDA